MERKNILWSKNVQKYFMAHKYMPKIFCGPRKILFPGSYILYVWSIMFSFIDYLTALNDGREFE